MLPLPTTYRALVLEKLFPSRLQGLILKVRLLQFHI